MGLLPCSCPLPCNKTRSECQKKSTHLQPESSTSSSLLSQPSLPLVPSLSSPQSSSVEHQCLATLKVHSSYVSSLALSGNSLFTGSCNSEIRVWSREPSENSTGKIVASRNGGVKSSVVLGDKIISAHQDHKIRVVTVRFMEKVGKAAHLYANVAGRVEGNSLDVVQALKDLQIDMAWCILLQQTSELESR